MPLPQCGLYEASKGTYSGRAGKKMGVGKGDGAIDTAFNLK